jgi:periplasmic glucans biosynthesis protein
MWVDSRVVRYLVPAALAFLAGRMLGLGRATNSPAAPAPFSFETLRQRAAALAEAPYRAEPNRLPDFLKALDYDHYLAIRFRPESGPWVGEGLPFTLQFFHPGYLYQDAVVIHLLEGGQVRDFDFSPNRFDYGQNRFPKAVPADLHFAGLRVLYPVNAPGKQDEVATFVGASYFRLLGARQRYGISARALTIDTAEPTGEEFPRFTEFWVERPAPRTNSLQLFALLDSPRAAGAYRFVIKPGTVTVMDLEAWLFVRKEIKKLGLAPLTSMFLAGANRTRYLPDFRPEVHDSDGLLLQTSDGKWLWRPLVNPDKAHHLSEFRADNLAGFGLLQRQRDFHDYEDLQARFDLRPSLWVRPQNTWGTGTVELVEIPTPNEWNDNIVAYWVPKQKAGPGQQFHWNCSLSALLGEPDDSPLLRVENTRIAPPHDKKPVRFVVDFNGHNPRLPASPAKPEAKVQASRGEVQNLVVETNEVTGGWRAFFDLLPAGEQEADLQLFLHSGDEVLSETWLYYWPP